MKKQRCCLGLVFGGGGNPAFGSKPGKKLRDFIHTQMLWIAFVVEKDVDPHTVDVGLFRSQRIAVQAKLLSQALKQAGSFDSVSNNLPSMAEQLPWDSNAEVSRPSLWLPAPLMPIYCFGAA